MFHRETALELPECKHAWYWLLIDDQQTAMMHVLVHGSD